jgi:phage shock protein A
MKPLTDAQIVELRVLALKRLIELHVENEKLKKEVKSRRHQADKWRKKAKYALSKDLGPGR